MPHEKGDLGIGTLVRVSVEVVDMQ